MKNQLKLELLENATDSLINGLNNYEMAIDGEVRYLKYAILSLSIYTELSLKYFITQINPLLIYKNAFNDKKLGEMTITTKEAINFLRHLNEINHLKHDHVEFSKNLKLLNDISNNTKHHKVDINNINEIKKSIGIILGVLDDLYSENKINIVNKLDESMTKLSELYRTVIDQYEYEEHLEKERLRVAEEEAQRLASTFDSTAPNEPSSVDYDDALTNCSSCENETFVLNINKTKYLCTYCTMQDIAVNCERCNKLFPQSEAAKTIGDYNWCCEECWDSSKKSKGCL